MKWWRECLVIMLLRTHFFEWHSRISEGCEEFEVEELRGRPVTARTNRKVRNE